jgi:hypothetical protein
MLAPVVIPAATAVAVDTCADDLTAAVATG